MMISSQIPARWNYQFTKASEELVEKILEEMNAKREDFARIMRNYCGKYVNKLCVSRGHNIVPIGIRESLASLFVGNTVTPTFEVNYVALGSDSTAPTENDTTLGTETLRATFSDRYNASNTAYFDKFFGTAEVGGNSYSEAGLFIDGTASIDTGFLTSRLIINETMSVNETLTINASLTFA
jgi:hypothetical protein